VYWRVMAGVVDVLDNVLEFCWKLQGGGSLLACQIDVYVERMEQDISLGLIFGKKNMNLTGREHESNQSSSEADLNAVSILLSLMRALPRI
jgi:hypothetical protein